MRAVKLIRGLFFVLAITCMPGPLCVNGVVACRGTTGVPGDANDDGVVDVRDVAEIINEALGLTDCVYDVNGDGFCDILDVIAVVSLVLQTKTN